MAKPLETKVHRLNDGAAESWMGSAESDQLTLDILAAIAILRDRIDELGGYHDDV